MKAYPLAILEKTGWECTTKLPTALDPVAENKKQVDMHLSIATSIKNTSKLAVVRVAISRRVKHAIELIIARGANVGTTTVRGIEKKIIVFDDEEAGPKWVLNGWMYILHPTLKLYRMPYHDLVPLVRSALRLIHDRGMHFEHQWAKVRARQSGGRKGSSKALEKESLTTSSNNGIGT